MILFLLHDVLNLVSRSSSSWRGCASPAHIAAPSNAVEFNVIALDDTSLRIDDDLVEALGWRDVHTDTVGDPFPGDLVALVEDIDVCHRWNCWSCD